MWLPKGGIEPKIRSRALYQGVEQGSPMLKLFFCALLLLVTFGAWAKQELTLAAVPYLVSKISAEVLREAYAPLGIEVRLQILPPPKTLAMANSGVVDGELNRIQGVEQQYPNLLRVPVAVNYIEMMVVTNGMLFKVDGWQSLRTYRIGYKSGIKLAEQATRGMYITSYLSDKKLLHDLKSGKIDLILVGRMEALDHLARQPDSNIKMLEPPLVKMKLYHYLNQKHRALLPEITRQLQQMHDSGRIEAIRQTILRKNFGSLLPQGPG
ncbi:substrate-binding periplasmic protein [Dongshaea marina]|uniref:substrate-binding periplasmic protein n=1 Tax=Dongshaea marina TaxID=2047966 RepID=UPI00131F08B6|nr:transporter substrate-binding domain-containing protein [Dongshaea marina]